MISRRRAMHLYGFRLEEAVGPLREGFISLGQLTAVIGANDVGKTRLVRSLAIALTSPPDFHARLYAELEPTDIERLVRAITDWHHLARPAFVFGEGATRREALQDPVASTLEAIRKSRINRERPEWAELCGELAESSLFAFEPAERQQLSWRVAWCLPGASDLAPSLQRHLEALRPSAGRSLLDLAAGTAVPDWSARLSDAEPYPLAELGDVPVTWLPEPIRIPTNDADIAAAATEVISELLGQLDWHDENHGLLLTLRNGTSPEHAVEFLDHLQASLSALPSQTATRLRWLERPQADTVRLSPDTRRAAAFIGTNAAAIAPKLIRDVYDFHVQMSPESVLSDRPLSFRLAHRDVDQTPEGRTVFGTDDAADGHRIWIQLVFLEATAALRDAIAELHELSDHIIVEIDNLGMDLDTRNDAEDRLERAQLEQAQDGEEDSDYEVEEAKDLLAAADSSLQSVCSDLSAAVTAYLDAVATFRSSSNFAPPASFGRARRAGWGRLRMPFFLIDEPERHLHPRVQRQFAAWMRDLLRIHDSQGLVVTHSVPFINQADSLSYVYRAGRIYSSVRSCAFEELLALGEIASELGLDRGQLLADVSVILFVEGPSDQYVLEALFRDRLRRIGVAIVPVHGATQLAQVADSQLLLRFSTARVAVLLDNLEDWEIDRLMSDPEHLDVAARSSETEKRAVAKLLKIAVSQGRVPTFLGLPAKDIFFVLDPEAIRETFRGLRRTDGQLAPEHPVSVFDDYPGHDQFWREFSTSGRKDEKWKAFCERTYGIPYDDISWYARVADNMRTRESFPPALTEVVDRVELLAQ